MMASTNGHAGGARSVAVEDLLYDNSDRRSSQLHDLLQTLWAGKWIILGVVLAVVLAAGAYTYTIPTTYRTSSLLLVDRDGQPSVLSGLGRGRTSPFGQDKTLQNELLILRQSRTIANRVAERLKKLKAHPETGAPLQILRGPEGAQRAVAEVGGAVKGMISAQASSEETDALYISARSHHPYEASLVANLYAEEYIQRTQEKSRADLKASREFLEEQADTLRTDVQAAEQKIQEYMQQEKAVSLNQETGRVVGQISELESERAQLRIQLDMKQAALSSQREELEKIEPRLAERLSSSLETRLSELQTKKAALESRIDRVERQNPDLDPTSRLGRELRQMTERAATLGRRTDSLARRYVEEALSAGGVASSSGSEGGGGQGVAYVAQQRRELAQKRIEINGLKARIDAVGDRLQENRRKLQEIPRRSMTLAQLQRERRSAEQIYSFVQEKLQEARLSEQSEMGYAEVIRPAGPGYPVGPDTRKNLMLALMLGLVGGGGLVILREQLDTRIHQPADLRDHGHSVLGVVPTMTPMVKEEFDGQDTVTVDGQALQTTLAMIVSPMSAAAEAYRRIRTNLQFARPDEETRTLAVSSADKGAGKTTTCANLALALASAGQETVVIDADLRRPWLHQQLGLEREPGLSTVLYEDDPSVAPFRTGIDHLSVIPAGAEVPNPAELLGSGRMRRLLEALETKFDYVIVDTPPALLFSDMLGLAPHCDGSILVARAGETDGHAFDHTVDRLHDVDADLLGCVLNEFDADSILYSNGSNYGYAYAHRQLQDYYEGEDAAVASRSRWASWWG